MTERWRDDELEYKVSFDMPLFKDPGCELIDATKRLATKKGLDPEKVKCDFPASCRETTCQMIQRDELTREWDTYHERNR